MSMTTNRFMMAHTRRAVKKLYEKLGYAMSAGEVAKYMGVARGTAVKYLRQGIREGDIGETYDYHVNNQQMTRYYPKMGD